MGSNMAKKLEVINKEFSPWKPMPFRLQTTKFFATIKHLNNTGVNLKDQKG